MTHALPDGVETPDTYTCIHAHSTNTHTKKHSRHKKRVPGALVIIPIRQGCMSGPWSGHRQEATNECISKWNDKLMFLSLKLIIYVYIYVCVYVSMCMYIYMERKRERERERESEPETGNTVQERDG